MKKTRGAEESAAERETFTRPDMATRESSNTISLGLPSGDDSQEGRGAEAVWTVSGQGSQRWDEAGYVNVMNTASSSRRIDSCGTQDKVIALTQFIYS